MNEDEMRYLSMLNKWIKEGDSHFREANIFSHRYTKEPDMIGLNAIRMTMLIKQIDSCKD